MSISDSTVKGKLNEIAGKAKQAFGDATGDNSVANRGAAQEVKGHAQQSWGSVKEAVHDTDARTTDTGTTGTAGAYGTTGHTVRDDITSAAAKVKEGITHATDPHKDRY